MAVNVLVKRKYNENFEDLLNRFINLCKKEKVLKQYKDHMSFSTDSEKREQKSINAKQ